jgi:hypothetical protein
MNKIKLTKGYEALVDDDWYEYLSQWKWCSKVGHWGVYAVRRPWNKETKSYSWVYMHREVNQTPPGMFTDHINGNGLDNRKDNLRTVTNQQNAFNTKNYSTNNTGHKGITWDKVNKKWRASIGVNYKTKRLGRFTKLEDAIKAREKAEQEYHVI